MAASDDPQIPDSDRRPSRHPRFKARTAALLWVSFLSLVCYIFVLDRWSLLDLAMAPFASDRPIEWWRDSVDHQASFFVDMGVYWLALACWVVVTFFGLRAAKRVTVIPAARMGLALGCGAAWAVGTIYLLTLPTIHPAFIALVSIGTMGFVSGAFRVKSHLEDGLNLHVVSFWLFRFLWLVSAFKSLAEAFNAPDVVLVVLMIVAVGAGIWRWSELCYRGSRRASLLLLVFTGAWLVLTLALMATADRRYSLPFVIVYGLGFLPSFVLGYLGLRKSKREGQTGGSAEPEVESGGA